MKYKFLHAWIILNAPDFFLSQNIVMSFFKLIKTTNPTTTNQLMLSHLRITGHSYNNIRSVLVACNFCSIHVLLTYLLVMKNHIRLRLHGNIVLHATRFMQLACNFCFISLIYLPLVKSHMPLRLHGNILLHATWFTQAFAGFLCTYTRIITKSFLVLLSRVHIWILWLCTTLQ
jgi:hypothetical protein